MSASQEARLDVEAFLEVLELPAPPRAMRSAQPEFDATKDQAMVVGSDIVSFSAGVSAEQRELIVSCSLLAQLAATRQVPSRDDVRAWYEIYFDTLTHLGWAAQARGFSEHRENGNDFEANTAILSIAGVVLGGASTAFAIVASTLNAMKEMSPGKWLTIFRRESQTAKAARFQVTVVEAAPASSGGGLGLSLMAFDLSASSSITQVLFFKFRSTEVTLRHASGHVGIDAEVLDRARLAIVQKVQDYIQGFVAALAI